MLRGPRVAVRNKASIERELPTSDCIDGPPVWAGAPQLPRRVPHRRWACAVRVPDARHG
jgi:hypothetical protein